MSYRSTYQRLFSLPLCLVLGLSLSVESEAPRKSRRGESRHQFDSQIEEASGIVMSRTYKDVMWVHSDSSTAAKLYATTPTGRLIQAFDVAGVENLDWEDIALDDTGYLYVGDIGNNLNNRRNLSVLKIKEPNPYEKRNQGLKVESKIDYRYPDQSFGIHSPPDFDAESLVWHGQGDARGLYLLTKHRSNTLTTLYRFPTSSTKTSRKENPQVSLKRIADFDVRGSMLVFGGMATGADISVDGKFLALLTYHAVFIFEIPSRGTNLLVKPVQKIRLGQMQTRQVEAVTWKGKDLILANEEGRLFVLPNPLNGELQRFP